MTTSSAGLGASAALRAIVLVGLSACLFLGWRELWFLTDDSYITFRHIDQFRRGNGYTWNAAPFLRVEGYSNFLWLILLHAVWVALGVEPPSSANVMSLLLACGAAGVAFLATWRLAWPEAQQAWRFWFAALVVLFAVTHRVFLTWSSSGLETSLFAFGVMCWVHGTLVVGRSDLGSRAEAPRASTRERGLSWVSIGGALAALTRPDGLLFFAASLALVGYAVHKHWRQRPIPWIALSSLTLVPAHVLWRYYYYDDWLPNTFYAKQVRPWPLAGVRYLASFCLEHALWLWPLVALVAYLVCARRSDDFAVGMRRACRSGAVALTVLLAHATYFILIVGGDHFEYRIFAHDILPLGIGLIVLLTHCFRSPARAAIAFVVIAAFGQLIPWVHYRRSSLLTTREATIRMTVPVADAFEGTPLHLTATWFDELQAWMMARHIGTRHQEHRVLSQFLADELPSRAEGEKTHWSQRVVIWVRTVGMYAWVFPEVAIIDNHGLTDPVVAHNPVAEGEGMRLMAHERTPPPGYLECLVPNAFVQAKQLIFAHPPGQLTDERIRECQTSFYPR